MAPPRWSTPARWPAARLPEFGPRRPDGSRPAGEWIARYIRAQGYEKLDYALFTHYHDDHIGNCQPFTT